MTIDLLNTEAFGNMACEQLHKTYVTLREQRSKALDKLRHEAIDKVSAELMKENHWWQVRTHEGVFLGFGYGNAETVANQFVPPSDYADFSPCILQYALPGNSLLF